MRDADVRGAVRKQLAIEHAHDTNTRIVEEMGVWSGSVRVDIAVINGELVGYELKSDRDTLSRLPQQAALYSRLFDRVHLVVGAKHTRAALELIPDWWGVYIATSEGSNTIISLDRQAKFNPCLDPLIVAQTLWRDEALYILEKHGALKGWKGKTAPQLHGRLAELLTLDELRFEVRTTLKERSGWLRKTVDNELHMPISAE